jgi:beta-glucosidase
MRFKHRLAVALVVMFLGECVQAADWKWAAYGLPPSTLRTCTPDTRGENDSWWLPYFRNKLKQPKKDLLFIGDSITDLWTYPATHKYPGGLDTWNKRYKDCATNYGVTGDKTQTVLWRLTEGKSLEGYAPRNIVLLIGINNLLQNDTPADTAEGIRTIVRYLRQKLPAARILILGIFPCWEKADNPIRAKIKAVNGAICKLADYRQTFFADIGDTFLEPDGSIRKAILRDLLHLSPRGYELWADRMDPLLTAMHAGDGQAAVWKRSASVARP